MPSSDGRALMERDEPERLTTDWGPNTGYDPDERAWEDAEDERYYGPSPEPVVGEPLVMGASAPTRPYPGFTLAR